MKRAFSEVLDEYLTARDRVKVLGAELAKQGSVSSRAYRDAEDELTSLQIELDSYFP